MKYTNTELSTMIRFGIKRIEQFGPLCGLTDFEIHETKRIIRSSTPLLVAHCSREHGRDPIRVAFLAMLNLLKRSPENQKVPWYTPWRESRMTIIVNRFVNQWEKIDRYVGVATRIEPEVAMH